MNAATSRAVSANRCETRRGAVLPWPGMSTATTRRPDAANAGPTRHQMPAFDVTPWMSRSGGSSARPQARVGQTASPASTVPASPEPGASSASATACGRSAVVAENVLIAVFDTLEL